jgi:hypothetical protein
LLLSIVDIRPPQSRKGAYWKVRGQSPAYHAR